MAGAILGEMPIEIGGKRYRFVLGTYGLAQLEQRLRKPWLRVFSEAGDPDALATTSALAIFHAGLVFHHEGMTERQASMLFDEFGMERFAQLFADAARAAMPEQERANPPTPTTSTNGTGIEASQSG